MNNSVWRFLAKMVAYLDMVIFCINFIPILYFLIKRDFQSDGSTANSSYGRKNLLIDCNGIMKVPSWALRCFTAVGFTITGIHIWAALELLRATENERDNTEALEKAREWRSVTGMFLIFTFLWGFTTVPIWWVFVIDIWRIISLSIVQKFMQTRANRNISSLDLESTIPNEELCNK